MTTTTHDFVLKLWIYCLNSLTSTHTHTKEVTCGGLTLLTRIFCAWKSTMVPVPTPFPRRSGGTQCALWAGGEDGQCRGERPGRQSCTAWTASSSMSHCNKHANRSMTGCKCNTDGNPPALSFQCFHEMLQHLYIYIYANKFMTDCECNTNSNTQSHSCVSITQKHIHLVTFTNHCNSHTQVHSSQVLKIWHEHHMQAYI